MPLRSAVDHLCRRALYNIHLKHIKCCATVFAKIEQAVTIGDVPTIKEHSFLQ